MTVSIKAAWLKLPRTVRSFIVDFVESAVGLVLAVNFFVPTSVNDAKALSLTVGAAIFAALVSAVRRHAPGWAAALRESFPA